MSINEIIIIAPFVLTLLVALDDLPKIIRAIRGKESYGWRVSYMLQNAYQMFVLFTGIAIVLYVLVNAFA